MFGLRRVFLRARDAQEKRDIKRMALLGSALIIVSSMFMSPIGPNNWIIPSAAFVMLSSGLGVLCLWWYPRITLRSRAAEVRNDPSAALRHRRERMRAFIGWALGTLAGGWGLFEGLMRISGLSP